mmetsp:Transcript_14141/g.25030  ORF Transcript_14141/g.25030 Transcript_14141/m.25030 type:complete len:302 (-) Transcript_14141:737-1642(-)
MEAVGEVVENFFRGEGVFGKGTDASSQIPFLLEKEGYPEKLKAASPVYAGLSEFEFSDTLAILVPHEGIRFYMASMKNVMGSFNPQNENEEWKVACFFGWFKDWFCPAFETHLRHEADSLNRFLSQETPGFPDIYTSNRGALLQYLEDIKAFEAELIAADTPAKKGNLAHDLKVMINKLVKSTNNHLNEEEHMVPVKLKEAGTTIMHFEEDCLATMSQNVREKSRTLPLNVYVMHSWAGQDNAEAYLDTQVPALDRWLLVQFWMKDFRTQSLQALKGLIDGQDPTMPMKETKSCTVDCSIM